MNGSPSLLPRIGRLLHARQFLVFYAIGLYTLTFVPPLVTGWLRERQPLRDLVNSDDALLSDLWSTRSITVAAIVVAYLALNAWFRAGYLRSLIGHLHWGPADGRQFRRLLGLTLFYELISWGFSFAFMTLGFEGPDADPGDRAAMLAQVVIVASLIVSLLLLYVDYAIVVSGTSLWRSFRRSLATVRDNRLISALITLVPVVVVLLSTSLTDGLAGDALQVLPTIVIVIVAWGALTFVIDVVLVCVYVDTLERTSGGVITDGE